MGLFYFMSQEVYILYSAKRQGYYIGQCGDVATRRLNLSYTARQESRQGIQFPLSCFAANCKEIYLPAPRSSEFIL